MKGIYTLLPLLQMEKWEGRDKDTPPNTTATVQRFPHLKRRCCSIAVQTGGIYTPSPPLKTKKQKGRSQYIPPNTSATAQRSPMTSRTTDENLTPTRTAAASTGKPTCKKTCNGRKLIDDCRNS